MSVAGRFVRGLVSVSMPKVHLLLADAVKVILNFVPHICGTSRHFAGRSLPQLEYVAEYDNCLVSIVDSLVSISVFMNTETKCVADQVNDVLTEV